MMEGSGSEGQFNSMKEFKDFCEKNNEKNENMIIE